ncbi:MAG TPA: hypothetical protein VNO30_02455 [Kofleriaceae bacterium]|nr:hypothetical protein [Kofleriaceae bacterium]
MAIVILAGTIAGVVSADDASDREALIREIDGLLGSAASDLRGAAGSGSGSSEVQSARGRVRQVKDKLSSLERVRGSDDRASNYVGRFPRYVEDFDRAAEALVQIKVNQRTLADLPRRCQDLDRQLVEQANRFAQDKDGDRIEELRRLALDAGSKAEDWWRDAGRKRDEMRRWEDDARRFSVSDGQWSAVTSNLHDAVARSLEAWMRELADVERECKNLRQRDRHPEVERVLRDLAGTAKGKDALYQQFEERLKRAESAIKDLASDSSANQLGDARDAVSEIERLVREVDAVKGSDRKANQIASQWPEYVRSFAPAATALQGLKAAQFQLDGVPAKCETSTRDLAAQLKKFIDDKDPDGLTEGPKLAEEAGEKYTRALAAMESARPTLRELVTAAVSFDPRDDRWNPLKRQVKEAADRMYEHWDKATRAVHDKCDGLAKGRRNPDIERFLTALGGTTQSELKDLQDQVAAWERDARDIYVLDCKDMQELWDAWCSVEIEPNEDPEIGVVAQKAAEIIDRESRRIDGVLARIGPLKETARKLGAKAKYRDAVAEMTREIEKHQGRLEKLKRKNGEWRGNNHPASQFTKTYGQQAHDKLASQYRCNVYDQSGYPGLGKGRPDCVVVNVGSSNACWIYEFKPQGYNGHDPLPAYKKSVSDYYTEMMRKNETPASNLGGAAFQALVEAHCREDPSKSKKEDRINFRTDFGFYDRCTQRYDCTQ